MRREGHRSRRSSGVAREGTDDPGWWNAADARCAWPRTRQRPPLALDEGGRAVRSGRREPTPGRGPCRRTGGRWRCRRRPRSRYGRLLNLLPMCPGDPCRSAPRQAVLPVLVCVGGVAIPRRTGGGSGSCSPLRWADGGLVQLPGGGAGTSSSSVAARHPRSLPPRRPLAGGCLPSPAETGPRRRELPAAVLPRRPPPKGGLRVRLHRAGPGRSTPGDCSACRQMETVPRRPRGATRLGEVSATLLVIAAGPRRRGRGRVSGHVRDVLPGTWRAATFPAAFPGSSATSPTGRA